MEPLALQTPKHAYRQEIGQLIQKARGAQALWSQTSFKQRSQYIAKMRQYLLEHTDRIAKIVSEDCGKSRVDALAAEIIPCTLACQWYAANAEAELAPRRLKVSSFLFLNKRTELTRLPLGVVAVISPWNYPLSIPFGEIVMGLMAGNAIVFKPSPDTPQVGRLVAEIVDSAGLPEGLFTLLEGDGEQIADALFYNGIDKVFFTGSVRVGKILMRQAAETLTPLSLELGGKDPMIVLADANLERAANGAVWGAFQNCGQTCAGIERLYVHESIYEDFLARLIKKTKELRHGRDTDHRVDIGAMTTTRQLQTVQKHVDDAVKQGAKIVAQSKGDSGGKFFPATLLTEVDHRMDIMREETFGPVLGVMKFRNEEEAVELANDSPYALTASIWTGDTQKGKALAKRVAAGVVTLNDHIYTHALSEVPWGGPKNSGIGRTHGALGLLEMTEPKAINWDTIPLKRNVFWFPYSEQTYTSLKAAMHLNFPTGPFSALKHAAGLLPYYLRKVLR